MEQMVSACRKIGDFGKHYMFTPGDLAVWPGGVLLLTSERDHWIPTGLQHRLSLLYPQAQAYRMAHTGHILGTRERAEYVAVIERFLTEVAVAPKRGSLLI